MSKNDFQAYNGNLHGIETVMRIHAVKRWHMIDTTRAQTLAEHSANVALLAGFIARTAPQAFFGNYAAVAWYGMVHDIPEAFTGDIPTHTKRSLTGLDELEEEVLNPAFFAELEKAGQLLVKICDLADGIRFIRLHGVDLTATHAQKGLEEQFDDRFLIAQNVQKWPENVLELVRKTVTFYAYEQQS